MRTSLALSALLTLFLLSGCGVRELTLSVAAPEGSVWEEAAGTFKTLTEERTEGRVRIRIYTGDPAGGDNRFTGGRDLGLRSVASLEDAALGDLALPWLFGGLDAVDEYLFYGPGRQAVFDRIRSIGAEPLALGENGFLQLAGDTRPVMEPSDAAGLRVRVGAEGPLADYLRILGAEVSVTGWEAAMEPLSLGELDGQADSLDAAFSDETYLVQRYLTLWDCAYDPVCLCAAPAAWARLDEADQAILRAAAEEACAAEIRAVRDRTAAVLEEMRESGVAVQSFSGNQRAAFQALSAPLFAARQGAGGLLDALAPSN